MNEALSPRTQGAAYLALGALALSCLLWARVPGLIDYPDHLARMWILAQDGGIADLAANYVVEWRLLPNLAMDLVVTALAKAIPVEIAGRVFIALTLTGIFCGTATLHRALQGRFGAWPLVSLLYLFNAALFFGFLSFLFGVACFLLAFSFWVATRNWRPVPRIGLFAAVAALLFVLHLFAFGLYGLTVMSYELGGRIRERRLSLSTILSLWPIALQFLPAALLFLASLGSAGPSHTAYGGFEEKIYAVQAPFTFGIGQTALDRVVTALSIGFFWVAWSRGWLTIVPEMRLPLAALLMAALVMPNWLSGSWAADIRVPVTLPFVLIASSRLELPGRRSLACFATVALLLLVARVGGVSASWADYDRRFGEFRAAAEIIPRGARLLVAQSEVPPEFDALDGVPRALAKRRQEVFWHMPALAVIDRSAFIPYLFTGWTPIGVAERNAAISSKQNTPVSPALLRASADPARASEFGGWRNLFGEAPYWRRWSRDFDFVLWLDFGRDPEPGIPALQLVRRGSFFRLYRIVKPEAGASAAAS